MARLFNTSWVDYEYDEFFKITSVSYYLHRILYSVVRSTASDKKNLYKADPVKELKDQGHFLPIKMIRVG